MKFQHHPECNEKCDGDSHFLKGPEVAALNMRRLAWVAEGGAWVDAAEDHAVESNPPLRDPLAMVMEAAEWYDMRFQSIKVRSAAGLPDHDALEDLMIAHNEFLKAIGLDE